MAFFFRKYAAAVPAEKTPGVSNGYLRLTGGYLNLPNSF
jgi:hypothetical protein